MFCQNCGKQIPNDAKFCDGCGNATNIQEQAQPQQSTYQQTQQNQPNQDTQQWQQPPQQNPYYNQPPSDNRKTYCVLSYIGILWLFGLCVNPEKHDLRVRFNVGQGIILYIFGTGISILVIIINTILGVATSNSYGIGDYDIYSSGPPVGIIAIQWILILASMAFSITFMIIGIVNVVNEQDKPLPLIGNLSFYR
jgi:hypothetical protein